MAFYQYTTEAKLDGGKLESVGVLYYHANGAIRDSFPEAIDSLTNRRLSPHNIIIFCEKGNEDALEQSFQNLTKEKNNRLSITDSIRILPYGYDGDIIADSIKEVKGSAAYSEGMVASLISNGIQQLVEGAGVSLKAPNGYEFQKPSLHNSRYFHRAGNMVKDPSSLSLLTHALLRLLPNKVTTLYIDSSTILAIALALQASKNRLAISCKIKNHSELAIHNFHSYAIDSTSRFTTSNGGQILISATGSGSLATKLVKEHGAKENSIWHIVSICSNDDLRETSVYFKEEANTQSNNDSHTKKVCIRDENFTASHSEPIPVRLGMKHVCKNDKKTFKKAHYQQGLRVKLRSSEHKPFSVFEIKKTDKDCHKEFSDWLKAEVSYGIPLNTDLIITTDSGLSQQLAEQVKQQLLYKLKCDIPIVTSDNITEQQGQYNTILVCCASTGRGEELLQTSQALRELKHEFRHYLVGHAFPESLVNFERLKANLTVTGKNRKYGFAAFRVNAVGKYAVHNSWIEESKLSYNEDGASVERGKQLKTSALEPDLLFLPKLDGGLLELRDESVLFDEPYNNISQAVVYLMVSCALEYARTGNDPRGDTLPENMTLQGNPFVSTVIDPDTFSRFNDGIIQAAILRSAAPDELNYAADIELSSQMKNIISAILKAPDSPIGEAALEFIFALHTKRLRLTAQDSESLKNIITTNKDLKGYLETLQSETPF